MKQISFTIPGEPRVQKRHRDRRGGGKFDPSAGDKEAFAWQAKALCPPDYEPMECDLHMVLMCQGTYMRGDIDNYLKFVMDALNGIYYKDDKQFKLVSVSLAKSEEPKTMVNISPWEPGPV